MRGTFLICLLLLKFIPECLFLGGIVILIFYFYLNRGQLLRVLAGFEFLALVRIIMGIIICKLGTFARIRIFIIVTFLVCGGRIGLGLLVRIVRWGGKTQLAVL